MLISPDADEIDWSGSCTSASGMTTGEFVVWTAVSSQPNLDLDGLFPANMTSLLQDVILIEDPLGPPVQNCDFVIGLDFDIDGVELRDMSSTWVTRDGQPALAIDFDRNIAPIASGDIVGIVDCPMAWNEPFLQPHVPDGPHTIGIDNFDLDIWITFDEEDEEIVATANVDVDIGSFTITPNLSTMLTDNVGSFNDILADQGVTPGQLESRTEAAFADGLSTLASEVATTIQNQLPTDHQICDLEVSSGELTITTQPDAAFGCLVRNPYPPRFP